MSIWSRLVVELVGLVPREWEISIPLRGFFNYEECKKEVVKWHRAELKKLDPPKKVAVRDNGYQDLWYFVPNPELPREEKK